MSNNATLTAYDLLLYTIRNARSIAVDQKRSYVERIEKGEWTPALRKELKSLCESEAALRAEDANLRRQLAAQDMQALAAEETVINEEQDAVMDEFYVETDRVKSDFLHSCDTIARETDKQIQAVDKEADNDEIASLRASLKDDDQVGA